MGGGTVEQANRGRRWTWIKNTTETSDKQINCTQQEHRKGAEAGCESWSRGQKQREADTQSVQVRESRL